MRTQLSKLIHAGLVLATVASGAPLVASKAVAQAPAHKKSTKTAASSSHSHTATTSHATASTTQPSPKSSPPKSTTAKSAKGKKSSKTKKVKGQAAPTPERINEIQDALAKRGMFSGEPTGKWDDSTADAMKKFQSTNHLNPTGKLDAPTLQKLGFGSETAGVAAPTPPPNSTANRLLSRNAPKDPEPADEN
jgi:peptidoglycan hydrolase-like protein with peptidoglycan-binding domain